MRIQPSREFETARPATDDLETSLDSESAALFRAAIRPLADRALGWPDLVCALAEKGYGLAFRNGRLTLTDLSDGRALCTARFAGIALRDLIPRLGRPRVHADCRVPTSGRLVEG